MPRKLTPQFIKAMEPPASGNRVEWDTDEKGLGIRITAAGHRAFVLRYVADGRERRLTLGEFPALGLTAAREMARERKGEVIKGADPLAEKAAKRAATTLRTLVDRYLAERASEFRPRTQVETRRALEKHWQPLHGLPVAEIDGPAITARLNDLAATSGKIAANWARSQLSALFTWAVEQHLAKENPVRGTAKPQRREKARERVLSAAELRAIWRATAGPGDFAAIVRLLMLTGQRREEVASMRWSEIDLDSALWTLPKERTKNRERHAVPLSEPVLIILAGVPRRPGRDLLFGDGKGSFSGWSRCKARLDARIAQPGNTPAGRTTPEPGAASTPWVLHDLRRTFISGLAQLGIAAQVAEVLVNHREAERAGVRGVYQRYEYGPEKREAMNRWAEHVMSIVAGEPAKVVPLRQRSA